VSVSDWRTRPHAPSAGTPLAPLGVVPHDNGLERVFGDGPRAFRVVLFRLGDDVRAYLNECPHVHIPFNFSADVFCVYEIDGHRDLMCAHHTAMFHLADGHCWDGPCRGERLIPVDVRIDDGVVCVA